MKAALQGLRSQMDEVKWLAPAKVQSLAVSRVSHALPRFAHKPWLAGVRRPHLQIEA